MRHTQHALGMANTYRQAAHNKEASLYIRRELLHFTDSSAREEYDKLPIDEKAETYLKQISKSSTSSGGETRQLRKIIDEYRWFKKKEDKWMHIAEHGGHHRSIIKPWTWFSFHNYHGHDLRADAELKFMEERARKKTTPSNTPEPPFPYDPAPLAFVHSKP